MRRGLRKSSAQGKTVAITTSGSSYRVFEKMSGCGLGHRDGFGTVREGGRGERGKIVSL